ncbi:MAG: FecR domain-containing protein, partial [Anaerolineae bacterium]|nr:FecR domain-containing protein [Anaerolineae bacterium]
MKRDPAHVIGEYLALVEKGDQAALIDLMARHPEELGSLSLHTDRPTRQEPATGKHAATLQAAGLFVMVLVALVFIAADLLPFHLEPGASPTATLTQADGEVYILAAGATWQPARIGTSIQAGDSVRTGPHSAAQLTFSDGSMTSLDAEAEIAVARLDPRQDSDVNTVVLQQRLGRTYNRIRPSPDLAYHFEIETPTAVTAVRGTEFVVDVEFSGATHVVVIEGVVDVTAQEVTVEVQARHETTVEPAQTPSAVRPASMPLLYSRSTPESSAEIQTPQTPGQPEAPQPSCTPQPTEMQPTKMSYPTRAPAPADTFTPTDTPEPTPTPQPTNMPQPTDTPTPTPTPQPTDTPTPTATNTLEPTKEPEPTKTPKPT